MTWRLQSVLDALEIPFIRIGISRKVDPNSFYLLNPAMILIDLRCLPLRKHTTFIWQCNKTL